MGYLKGLAASSLLISGSLICSTLIPSLAHAGWQTSTWGMSVEEAALATGAKPNSDEGKDVDDLDAKLKMAYLVDRIDTEATLLFDSNGDLAMVKLTPVDYDADCLNFSKKVSEVYGSPETEKKDLVGITDTWRDTKNNNLVTLTWSGFPAELMLFCFLNYEPLPQRSSEGGL